MSKEVEASLIHPKERRYFRISSIITLLVYAVLIITVKGLLYIAIAAVISLFLRGIYIGSIRANGIRVSQSQFPEVYRIAADIAERMGVTPLPAIYVLQAGGVLNALATKLVGVNYVIIYSDVLELAYEEQGGDALSFILCHEMAHIKRNHIMWHMLFAPARLLMASSYTRACEYTCDRYGAYYCPHGAANGLLIMAAGTRLYRQVNAKELSNQVHTERGIWMKLAESLSTHPNLSKRLHAVEQFLAQQPIKGHKREI